MERVIIWGLRDIIVNCWREGAYTELRGLLELMQELRTAESSYRVLGSVTSISHAKAGMDVKSMP